MESLKSKDLSAPLSSSPAYFTTKNYGPRSYKNGKILLSLFCVLRTWLGNYQVGGSKIQSDRNVGCTLFMAKVYRTAVSPQKNYNGH